LTDYNLPNQKKKKKSGSAIGNMQTYEHDCGSIKLYLQKQEAGCNLLISDSNIYTCFKLLRILGRKHFL
jgi:hypothetical protein